MQINKTNVLAYGLILISVSCQACAAIFAKLAGLAIQSHGIIAMRPIIFYGSSMFFLGVQAIFWQKILTKFNLSYVYFFTALIYIYNLLIGKYIFHESISRANIVGVSIIIIGVIILSAAEQKHD